MNPGKDDFQDDFLADLGVTLPTRAELAAEKAAKLVKRPKFGEALRHTEWNNFADFEFTGYVAKMRRITCDCCGEVTEVMTGIFTEEIHTRSRSRRLQVLGRGAVWPAGEEHRLEVEEERAIICGKCVREIGFSRESVVPTTFTLRVGE